MQYGTIVEAAVPRAECPEHGVHQIDVPWAESGSRFTALFEAMAIDWLRCASINDVARQLHVSWNAIDRIQKQAVRRGLKRRENPCPRHISVDETSFQRRHEYVTVVTDQETGAVIYVADGRSGESLDGFFDALPDGAAAQIETISMDMHLPYINAVRRWVPDADRKICFDKFHVAKLLGEAVDDVRRQEHKTLSAQGDNRLKRSRYNWLTNPLNMRKAAWDAFQDLRESTLKTARAWAIKEQAMGLWHYRSRAWALKQWGALIAWGERSQLTPIRKAVATIKRHLWGIVNAIIHQRSNAHAESVNSRIQKVKRRACGFRNRDRFRDAILFHYGSLNLYPDFPWR